MEHLRLCLRPPQYFVHRWWWRFEVLLGHGSTWHSVRADVYEEVARTWLNVSNAQAQLGRAVEALRAAQHGQDALDKAEYHAYRASH